MTAQVTPDGQKNVIALDRREPLMPSRLPARRDGFMSFASNPVVYGAARLMFSPREQWTEDNYGRPVYVHETEGKHLHGRTYYTIILPSTDAEPANVVNAELAWDIQKRFGIDTAWLHMMLCAYASDRYKPDRPGHGKTFAINRDQVIRALGIPDVSREEQDRRACEQIQALQSIYVQGIRLEPVPSKSGKPLVNFFSISPHHLWEIAIVGCGQMYMDFDEPEVPRFQTWQLVGREGLWATAFLDGPASLRQLGWLSPEQFEFLDRRDGRSSPWPHQLTIELAFRNRFRQGEPVTMNNADIIKLCGGNTAPATRRERYDTQLQVHNAILAMEGYGCKPDFSEWPRELWPVPTPEEMDAADEAVFLDGAGAASRRMPKGYWETWLHCRTTFTMPAAVALANAVHRELPAPKPKPAALTGEDVRRLREAQGMTQRELAEFLGVTQSLISRVEKGKRQLDNRQQKRLRNMTGDMTGCHIANDGENIP